MRVVVADDQPDVAESIRDALVAKGLNAECVFTSSEAVNAILSNRFDALIIDVEFSNGMSGIDALRIIRRHNTKVIVIVISAVDYSDKVRQQALELGATFFEKTVSTESLMGVLTNEE